MDTEDDDPQIFCDSASGSSVSVWVDTDLWSRSDLIKRLESHGAKIALSHYEPEVALIVLSPRSPAIFDMYCHPSWLAPRSRRMHEHRTRRAQAKGEIPEESRRSTVIVKERWIDACVQAGRLLGEADDWGGYRAGGPPLTRSDTIERSLSVSVPPLSDVRLSTLESRPAKSPPKVEAVSLPDPPSAGDNAARPAGSSSKPLRASAASSSITQLPMPDTTDPAFAVTAGKSAIPDSSQVTATPIRSTANSFLGALLDAVEDTPLPAPGTGATPGTARQEDQKHATSAQGSTHRKNPEGTGDFDVSVPMTSVEDSANTNPPTTTSTSIAAANGSASIQVDHASLDRTTENPTTGDSTTIALGQANSSLVHPPHLESSSPRPSDSPPRQTPVSASHDTLPIAHPDSARRNEVRNDTAGPANGLAKCDDADGASDTNADGASDMDIDTASPEAAPRQSEQQIDASIPHSSVPPEDQPDAAIAPDPARLFAGLRIWVDPKRPNRSELLTRIRRAAGTIATHYLDATHVLVYDYSSSAKYWDGVVRTVAQKGVWFLNIGWAIKSLADSILQSELSYCLPGGAPPNSSSIKRPGPDYPAAARLPTRFGGAEAKMSTEDLATLFKREWDAHEGSKVSLLDRIHEKYGSYTRSTWSNLFDAYRNRSGRFKDLTQTENDRSSSSKAGVDGSPRTLRSRKSNADPASGPILEAGDTSKFDHQINEQEVTSGDDEKLEPDIPAGSDSRESLKDQSPAVTAQSQPLSTTMAGTPRTSGSKDSTTAKTPITNSSKKSKKRTWPPYQPENPLEAALEEAYQFLLTSGAMRRRLPLALQNRIGGPWLPRYIAHHDKRAASKMTPEEVVEILQGVQSNLEEAAMDGAPESKGQVYSLLHPLNAKYLTFDCEGWRDAFDSWRKGEWPSRSTSASIPAISSREVASHSDPTTGSARDATQVPMTGDASSRSARLTPSTVDQIRPTRITGTTRPAPAPVGSFTQPARLDMSSAARTSASPPLREQLDAREHPDKLSSAEIARVMTQHYDQLMEIGVYRLGLALTQKYPVYTCAKWTILANEWQNGLGRFVKYGKEYDPSGTLKARQLAATESSTSTSANNAKQPLVDTSDMERLFRKYTKMVEPPNRMSVADLGALIEKNHGGYNAATWANRYRQWTRSEGRFANKPPQIPESAASSSASATSPSKRLRYSPASATSDSQPSKRLKLGSYTEEEERKMAAYIIERLPEETLFRRPDWQQFASRHPHRSAAAYAERYRNFHGRIDRFVSEAQPAGSSKGVKRELLDDDPDSKSDSSSIVALSPPRKRVTELIDLSHV